MSNQTSSKSQYLANSNYWIFSAYFFAFFFIMATCYPFLGIWLGDIHGLKGEKIGYVFSSISLFALLFQPIRLSGFGRNRCCCPAKTGRTAIRRCGAP